MGNCCCKDTSSELGESDRLLVNPVSDDEDLRFNQHSGYGTLDGLNGVSGAMGGNMQQQQQQRLLQQRQQPDLQAAVSQILESVAVQVIDVASAGHAGAQPVLEQQEYLQRSRALLKAGNDELRGQQQPRRALPLVANNTSGASIVNVLSTAGSGSQQLSDLQLVAGAAQAVAHAIFTFNVKPPEDLLVQFGAPQVAV